MAKAIRPANYAIDPALVLHILLMNANTIL